MRVRFKIGVYIVCLIAAMGMGLRDATARGEAGLLTCEVSEGFEFIFSSPRDLHCVFRKLNGQNESYRGTMREFGANFGVSGRGVIAWTVLAETTQLPPGSLSGSYGGVEAGAAAIIGGRGQILVGGSRRTISLQPLSLEGEIGINIALGITSLELHPLFRGKVSKNSVAIPAVGHSYDSVPHHRQTPHYGCGSYTHLMRGETLYGLAHECGVTVEALLDANPNIRNVRKISAGALVHLPRHVGHHGSSPCGNRAVLQGGETLDHLAWRCGVTLHALLRANPDVRELQSIDAGLVLAVPSRRAVHRRAPIVWARTETASRSLGQIRAKIANDALVPGTKYQATGRIQCSRSAAQPMQSCVFGVTREGGGKGSIKVSWPDGGSRVIFYENGTPAYFDYAQADGNAKMTVGKKSDMFIVRIGSQRFEIPEAVITGG